MLETKTMETPKVFKEIGFALFTMISSVVGVQMLISILIKEFAPGFEQSGWYIGLLVGIPFYCVGFPIFLFMMKEIPNGPKGETKKMPFGHIIVMFFICMAGTYIFNIVGLLINMIIGLIKGANVINPLLKVVGASSIIPTLIFIGILSPIIEEIVFRGILLDKLRGYGDKTAIWVTALIFALFHGNLSQFFYAFVLGLFFGYVATKTNTIKYTVILHIAINIVGSVIMPALALNENQVLVGIAGLIVIIVFIVGLILFIMNFKKVSLVPGESEIDPSTRKKVIYGNMGMILYYVVCLYLFISVIIA